MRTNSLIATSFSAVFLLSASAFAADNAVHKVSPQTTAAGKPVKLSDTQLDQISAGAGKGGISGDVHSRFGTVLVAPIRNAPASVGKASPRLF
jgi:hypothetical protein